MNFLSLGLSILLLFSIHPFLFAEEKVDTLQLPTITVFRDKPTPFRLDTTNISKQFEQVSGLSIRKYASHSPSFVSILGAPITGTKLEFHGVEWNDPRTNLADLNELPFWKYQRVQIEVGESSVAQSGIIKVNPVSPADFRGWTIEHRFQSNLTQSIQGLISFGDFTPTGVGFQLEKKTKGDFPSTDSHSRLNYGGFQRSSVYLNHMFVPKIYPLQFEVLYSNSKIDLTGLINRAVESETQSTKEMFRTIIGVTKPIPVRFSYIRDDIVFNRPQWQYSPNGVVPFTPFSERSKRNGLSTQTYHHGSISRHYSWKGQLDWQLDDVRFNDELSKTQYENKTRRNLFTFQNHIVQTFQLDQIKFYHKYSITLLYSNWQPTKKNYHTILPYLNVKWYPIKELEVVHKFGKAVRLPSLQELFLSPTVFSKGNPNLFPEISKEIQTEINYHKNANFRFSILGYTRWIENGIVWKRNSRGQYTSYNTAKIFSNGGIVSTEISTGKSHKFITSVSLTDSRNDNTDDINYKKQMPLIPKNQFNITWVYTPTFDMQPELKLKWNYVSQRYTLESNTDFLQRNQLSSESIYDVSLRFLPFQSKSELEDSYYIEISCDNILNTRRWWSEGIPNQDRIWTISIGWNQIGVVQ